MWNLVPQNGRGTWAEFIGNRVLRKIFLTKEEEVARKWRKLHTKELCDMHYS